MDLLLKKPNGTGNALFGHVQTTRDAHRAQRKANQKRLAALYRLIEDAENCLRLSDQLIRAGTNGAGSAHGPIRRCLGPA